MLDAVLSILLFGGGTGPASPAQASPVAKGATIVAVVDIGRVLQAAFPGGSDFGRGLGPQVEEFKAQAERISAQIVDWKKMIQNSRLNKHEAEVIRENICSYERGLEVTKTALSKAIGLKQEQDTRQLWIAIQRAVKTYASENGIDIVLGYGDPAQPELIDQFPNINRKMQAMDLGSTVPLFVSPRADITAGVIEVLKRQRREK